MTEEEIKSELDKIEAAAVALYDRFAAFTVKAGKAAKEMNKTPYQTAEARHMIGVTQQDIGQVCIALKAVHDQIAALGSQKFGK